MLVWCWSIVYDAGPNIKTTSAQRRLEIEGGGGGNKRGNSSLFLVCTTRWFLGQDSDLWRFQFSGYIMGTPSVHQIPLINKRLHAPSPAQIMLTYTISKQTWNVAPMLFQWWASVADCGPTLKQYWINVPCLLWSAELRNKMFLLRSLVILNILILWGAFVTER